MSFLIIILSVLTPLLDYFWLSRTGLSFLIIALCALAINRRHRAALALALGAGLVTDIIFPGATFGFWLFYNLAAWWLIDRLARDFFSGQGWGVVSLLIFLAALAYAAGREAVSYLINFWQNGDGRAAGHDLWVALLAALATALVGAVILRLTSFSRRPDNYAR